MKDRYAFPRFWTFPKLLFWSNIRKTVFISVLAIALISTRVAVMLWQDEPVSSNQTSMVVEHQQPIFEKQPPIDDQIINRPQVLYQRVNDRGRKPEIKPQVEPLPDQLSEADNEAWAIEEKLREQEEDQRFNDRLSTYYAELENQHLLQAVDSDWASSKQEQLISSFETQSLRENIDLAGIECRSNSCIIDFEILSAKNESDPSSSTFFDWLLENTGNCEIHGEAAVATIEPEELATQRVYLVNCV